MTSQPDSCNMLGFLQSTSSNHYKLRQVCYKLRELLQIMAELLQITIKYITYYGNSNISLQIMAPFGVITH